MSNFVKANKSEVWKQRIKNIPDTRRARILWSCMAAFSLGGTGYLTAEALKHEGRGYDTNSYPANIDKSPEAIQQRQDTQDDEFAAMTWYFSGALGGLAITGISVLGAIGRERINDHIQKIATEQPYAAPPNNQTGLN